ncbi:hypothetical protein PF005_g18893 [Phytophthora fragariae]|uniref:Uncharacterized protein n=1 Tax=Phytophthora fragariae TaxID=53985 RepID=A0A6A3WY48_9STRA|nr:hypothetical protein PF003_g11789 [Phytophthora fragariae]KAE8930072.1 hypothetical protein PF009_g19824 [Phytophthora fragariae]KAE8991758.1 hypothetical protein PF011_g17814 [Phytophthora fragariae]KAE9091323.1 hypothetical protein PF007_g18920 [Phytophthora fragariae]KAE9093034.1 hypothetical protein PF010_g17643 [Phytophthora fragariae]
MASSFCRTPAATPAHAWISACVGLVDGCCVAHEDASVCRVKCLVDPGMNRHGATIHRIGDSK